MYMPPVNPPCHASPGPIDQDFTPVHDCAPIRARCGGLSGPPALPPDRLPDLRVPDLPYIEPPIPSGSDRVIEDVEILQSFQSDLSMSDRSARRAIRVGASSLLRSPLVADNEELRHLADVLVALGADPGVSDAAYRRIARSALASLKEELIHHTTWVRPLRDR